MDRIKGSVGMWKKGELRMNARKNKRMM